MRRWLWTGCLLAFGTALRAAPIWIDVRTAEEFASGHVPGALHIPLQQITLRIREVTTDPQADLRLYCGIGVRAQIAKLQLESAGYRNVTNEGGYAEIVARRPLPAAAQTIECRNTGQHPDPQEGPC